MKYFVLILLMAVLLGCEPVSSGHDRDMKLLESNPDAYLVIQLIRECRRASSDWLAKACFEALEEFDITIPKGSGH